MNAAHSSPERAPVILNVDDNEAGRYATSRILRKAGFEVREAENGREAMEKAKAHPDLIILDVNLPDMSGFDVCRKLRGDPTMARVPVLHLSATHIQSENRSEGLEGGADGFLAQPVEPRELVATVNALLRAKQAEDAALAVADQWSATFNSIRNGICLLDRDGRILRCNKAFEEMAMQGNETLAGRKCCEIMHNTAEFAEDCPVARTLKSGKKETADLYIRGRWFEVTADPIMDSQGALSGIIHLMTDITSRKILEQELTTEKEKAEAASLLKSHILANLSHEFRTPLHGILGIAELLNSAIDDCEQKDSISLIGEAGRRLFTTLDALMKLAQISAGEFKTSISQLHCGTSVKAVVDSFRKAAEKKNLALHLELAGDIVIRTDDEAFQYILCNLLDNALKFTNQGKITILVKQEEVQGSTLGTVSVMDTGIGITAEQRELLFQEFRQASEGISRSYEGSGLGLALAQKMTGLLGGTLTFQSEPGKGSTFTIAFPAGHALPAQAPPAPLPQVAPGPLPASAEPELPGPAVPGSSPEVLLVEDNFINALVVSQQLENLCRVDHAEDGEKALSMASKKCYHALLLDINLGPGMDGTMVLKELRKMPAYEHAPAAAITGYALSGDRQRLLGEGFDYYLAKPFSTQQLVDTVMLMTGNMQNIEPCPSRKGAPYA